MGIITYNRTRKNITLKKSIGERTYSREYLQHVLARAYNGWTLDYIKNMTDIEIYDALDNLSKMIAEENVQRLQLNTLATRAGAGDKRAIQAIKEIIQKHTHKQKIREHMASNAPQLTAPRLTEAELEQISKGNYDGIGRKS